MDLRGFSGGAMSWRIVGTRERIAFASMMALCSEKAYGR